MFALGAFADLPAGDGSPPDIQSSGALTEGKLVGIAHIIYHRSCWTTGDYCYLQDLFTAGHLRGRGVGRLLIQAVYDAAKARDSRRVYWLTGTGNATAQALYNKLAERLGVFVYAHEF